MCIYNNIKIRYNNKITIDDMTLYVMLYVLLLEWMIIQQEDLGDTWNEHKTTTFYITTTSSRLDY